MSEQHDGQADDRGADRRCGYRRGGGPIEELTPEQIEVMEARFRLPSWKEAANEVGVSRQQVSRWLNHNPTFQEVWDTEKQLQGRALRESRLRTLRKAFRKAEEEIERGNLEMVKLIIRQVSVADLEELSQSDGQAERSRYQGLDPRGDSAKGIGPEGRRRIRKLFGFNEP